MNISHPKTKGSISEQFILAHFMSLGYDVSVPVGDNSRYDLIVDTGDKLHRIQSRTGSYRNGCINVFTSSSRMNSKGYYKTRFTEEDVDFFAIYHEGKVYVVPIKDLENNKSQLILRIEPPKNGQVKNVRWASDYLLSEYSLQS